MVAISPVERRSLGYRAMRRASLTLLLLIAALPAAARAQLEHAPVGKMAAAKKRQLALGRELFTRPWQPTARNKQGDGLGPLFNERSCAACHKQGGVGGGGPAANNVQIINVGKLDPNSRWGATESMQRALLFSTLEHDKNSLVLHRFGMHSQYARWRAERLAFAKPGKSGDEYAARVTQLAEAGISADSRVVVERTGLLLAGRRTADSMDLVPLTLEERNTSALFGAGLIDQVQAAEMREIAEMQPATVRGRLAALPDGRVGRFGWKAQNVSLSDFNENACAVELGLETATRKEARLPFFPRSSDAPLHGAYREVEGEDVSREELEAMTAFVASLPQPRQVLTPTTHDAAIVGAQIFHEIGCADCHTPNLGVAKGIYSDLLLHRMGGYGSIYYGSTSTPEIASSKPPQADEFRTPPLWGVADSAPYMHDGGAATLHDAVLAHGVQGDAAGKAYRELTDRRRKQLLAFLQSLRAPELAALAGR